MVSPDYKCKKGLLKWADTEGAKWAKCDVKKTTWGVAQKMKSMILQTHVVPFDLLTSEELEEIDVECRKQAKDHCK